MPEQLRFQFLGTPMPEIMKRSYDTVLREISHGLPRPVWIRREL